MARPKGALGKNKAFLLNRLKDMYGKDFDPVMKMAEQAATLDQLALNKYPPLRRRVLCMYIYPPRKKIMILQLPNPKDTLRDALEAHISRSKDFLLISIGDVGVEVGSTLTSEQELFYLELAKTLVIKDWLGDD